MSRLLIQKIRMSTLTSDLGMLKSKFRGALYGALMGDCLGAPYEGDEISHGDKIIIQRTFDQLESSEHSSGPKRPYTDDTAMTISVLKTLINNHNKDISVPLAKNFCQEYFNAPHRGYGQNVVDVFNKLRRTKFTSTEDVLKPAQEQFNGTGSYGNGSAMRIAPVALYHYQNTSKDDTELRSTVIEVSRLTHTHPLGIHGAILQSFAVKQALLIGSETQIDAQQFCEELKERMKDIEKENIVDGFDLEDTEPYQEKLKLIQYFLREKYTDNFDEAVINGLGNSISALYSVPTAIFCFLKALQEIPTIKTDNILRRTIQYAITLGGDTDTIASMSGAIAGAYLGEAAVNENLLKHCEAHDEIKKLADQLCNQAVNNN